MLRRLPTYQEVPRGTPYKRVFRSGARFVLTLIMMYDDSHADTCPGCHSRDGGVEDITKLCSWGVVYTRARAPNEHIIMLPSHSALLEETNSDTTLSDARVTRCERVASSIYGPTVPQEDLHSPEVPVFETVDS